jgi:hypothetical protein
MKNQKRIQYFIVIFVISALTYHQSFGLNLFLISIISVIYLKFNQNQKINGYWWLSALLWIGSGLALTLNNGFLSPFLYVITALNFYNVSQNHNSQFPFTLLKSTLSFFIGIINGLFPKSFFETKEDTQFESKNLFKKILTYSIPVVIVIIFLKLYQQANPKFAEITEFINLDFINWGFILTYIILYVMLNGFYFYYPVDKTLDELGNNKSTEIKDNYTDIFQTKFGVENELKMSKLIVITLSILLTVFLIVDFLTVFDVIENKLSHSENVHQGIFILIISIIFVIIIVSFTFRGKLNFTSDKILKNTTILWLILNVILIVLNGIKNNNYIADWGLTHKRIGVFAYLFLCLLGLIFTIYKIQHKKSFWYLLNKTVLSFMSFLVIYSMINWNGIIAKYNLDEDRFPQEKIDLYYNINLGYEAYPYLMDYFDRHPIPENMAHKRFDYRAKNFKPIVKSWKDIPSFNLSQYLVYQKLQNYKPLVNNDYYDNNLSY